MQTRMLNVLIIVILLAACQPVQAPAYPTDIPFPTMTVGQRVDGQLSSSGSNPQQFLPGQSNPATAAALANRPTPTPDSSACPAQVPDVELGAFPDSRVSAIDSMVRFLNSGGSSQALRDAILSEWNAFSEAGYLRDDVDLTGEGRAEIVLGYIAPGDVGTLLVFGCQAGRYVQLYESIADGIEPPVLIALGDMNNEKPNELILARRECRDADTCDYQTQVIQWMYTVGRFVNLIPNTLLSLNVPAMRDMDNDSVQEIVITLDSSGTAATGPLRTGINIYDWDGQFYVLSIVQLDPPRYRIQVIHEGDRAFSRLEMETAIAAYQIAIRDNDELRYWFNDGPINEISYALYRLILAYAYTGNGGGILETVARLQADFPLAEDQTIADAPIYVQMANRFVDALTITGDLHESCLEVQAIISENSDAVDFMNRYGSRSQSYTALDLCPF